MANSDGGRPRMTRVLVVEDQRALADALQIAIDAQPDLECAGVATTAEDSLRQMAERHPDVVLMDIHLRGTDGIEGTRQIKAYAPGVRVLILTGDTAPALFTEAATAGADAFLAKDSAFPDILTAIRTPAGKKIMVEGATLAALFRERRCGTARFPHGENWARLTEREREVLGLMGEGLDPGAIAGRLTMSPHTARGHVKNVMTKVDAHTQLEAVVIAIRTGLLPVPPTPYDRF